MAQPEFHKHLGRVGQVQGRTNRQDPIIHSELPGSFVFNPEEIYLKRTEPVIVFANNTIGEFCTLLGISLLAKGLLSKNKPLGTVAAASIAALGLKIITQTDKNEIPPSPPPTNPSQW